MTRDPRLRGLSSDHHQALVLARSVARAAAAGRADAGAARALATRFAADLEPHFRVEEELLVPALRAAGEHALVARLEADHAAMREVAAEAATGAATRLGDFARRLEAHVRFEERELFPCCEARLPAAVLAAVAARVPAPVPAGDVGIPSSAPGDLVDLLLQCHERIRRFVDLARVAGERVDAPAPQIADACAQVVRYYGEALPLHVADEDESILPRLRQRSQEIDAALATMHAQHRTHEPAVAALLEAAATLGERPGDPVRHAALAAAARHLADELGAHLALEEATIFPAIRALLDADAERDIVEELRARRRGGGPA